VDLSSPFVDATLLDGSRPHDVIPDIIKDHWLPLTPQDRDAGYWWELSMRQIETSRTIVFDAPRHARASSKPSWSTKPRDRRRRVLRQ